MSSNEIVKREEDSLEIIGVEPWAVKSIPRDRRAPFLKDAAKLVAKYHHPDLYQEDADKKKHQAYLARVNQVVERLTSDKFALEDALAEFNSKPSDTTRSRINLNSIVQANTNLEKRNKELVEKMHKMERDYEARLQAESTGGQTAIERLENRLEEAESVATVAKEGLSRVSASNVRHAEKIAFLQSARGPYKRTEASLMHLRKTMLRRYEFEKDALNELPPLYTGLEGTLDIREYAPGGIFATDFVQAKMSPDPINAMANLFTIKAGDEIKSVKITEGSKITLAGTDWEIMGILPYELTYAIGKNPLRLLNGRRRKGRMSNEFETSILPYTVPFIGTVTTGLTLLKSIPGKEDQYLNYRTVAVDQYDLHHGERTLKATAKPGVHPFIGPIMPPALRTIPIEIADPYKVPEVREIDIDRGD